MVRSFAILVGLAIAGSCLATDSRLVNYPTIELLAAGEVDAIAEAIQAYVGTFRMTPPLSHRQLFPLLDGKNPRNQHFLFIEQFRRNSHGEVVDPWKDPYLITMRGGRIVVASRRIHYAKIVTLPKQK